MILLLYSTLLQHKKEHYNPCDNTLSVGKCKIDIPSIKGEGPSLICEKCGKNNNHCKNASDIFKPDGSCSLCINTFDNIESIKDKKDLRLLFRKIYKKGYSRLLIETGLTFLNNLLKNKLVHDLYIFKSDKKLGKNGKNNDTIKYLKKISPKSLTINLNGDNLLKKEF